MISKTTSTAADASAAAAIGVEKESRRLLGTVSVREHPAVRNCTSFFLAVANVDTNV